ncbi:MAG: hypothetical protein B6I37_05735 [Desulfobacteraceae bacterium 4572_35.2]|nr:MAG: hypothetical protein B6I37_05735 [Desulfobacteraceae bacterium 4572_35.2]
MTTTAVLIALFVLLVGLAIAIFFVRSSNEKHLGSPAPRQVLVPANEQLFMQQIGDRFNDRCWLFWNVTLLDLLRIGTGTSWHEYKKHNMLLERRFSCVICLRDDFSIQGIVDFVPDNRSVFDPPARIVPGLSLKVVTVSEKELDDGALESLLLAGFPHLEALLSEAVPPLRSANLNR